MRFSVFHPMHSAIAPQHARRDQKRNSANVTCRQCTEPHEKSFLVLAVLDLVIPRLTHESCTLQNFRTVFFINCAAQEDLLNLFSPAQLELLRVVIIDSHRPIHYNNFWHRNIWIFHDPADGDVIPEEMPKPDGLSDCEDEGELSLATRCLSRDRHH